MIPGFMDYYEENKRAEIAGYKIKAKQFLYDKAGIIIDTKSIDIKLSRKLWDSKIYTIKLDNSQIEIHFDKVNKWWEFWK